MWSIIAARVVDFPEPVDPVTRIRPRRSAAILSMTGGSPSSVVLFVPSGITRRTTLTVPRLLEDVGAKSSDTVEAVTDVHFRDVFESLLLTATSS